MGQKTLLVPGTQNSSHLVQKYKQHTKRQKQGEGPSGGESAAQSRDETPIRS